MGHNPARRTCPLPLVDVHGVRLVPVVAGAPLSDAPVTNPASSDPPEHRPTYHFSPAKNWMNDPNGLVFHKGVYHLFFQYNPLGNVWGNMSWGHATSTDLVHWDEQPVAIPFDANEGVFSGSVVVDTTNSSGFGSTANPALVAMYTSAYTPASGRDGIQAQSLAYSNDGGYTWTKHRGNPVLDRGLAHFRDPKVFRYEPARSWRMVIAIPGRPPVCHFRPGQPAGGLRAAQRQPAGQGLGRLLEAVHRPAVAPDDRVLPQRPPPRPRRRRRAGSGRPLTRGPSCHGA